ncbi:2-phospho-L-lactate transferase CofD family protein, partial [Clostridioides difficile]
RNCLLALANIEPTMNEVMQYRFTEGLLKGQSFGNLFLAAMNGKNLEISDMDRGLATELIYGVIENKYYLDYIINKLSKIKVKKM